MTKITVHCTELADHDLETVSGGIVRIQLGPDGQWRIISPPRQPPYRTPDGKWHFPSYFA